MTAKSKEAETIAQAQPVQRAGLVMAILFLIFFLGVSDNQMISPLLPFIAADFGIGRIGAFGNQRKGYVL